MVDSCSSSCQWQQPNQWCEDQHVHSANQCRRGWDQCTLPQRLDRVADQMEEVHTLEVAWDLVLVPTEQPVLGQVKDQGVEQNQMQRQCGVQKPVQGQSTLVEQCQVQLQTKLQCQVQIQAQCQAEDLELEPEELALVEPVAAELAPEAVELERELVELVAAESVPEVVEPELELVELVVAEMAPEAAEPELVGEELAVVELVLVPEQAFQNLDSTKRENQCRWVQQPQQPPQLQQLVAEHVACFLQVVHEDCE